MHTRTKINIDIMKIEDLQFDKLLGKERGPITENDLAQHESNSLPFISKDEESKILEANQTMKLDQVQLGTYVNYDQKFKNNCLQLNVPSLRDYHDRLMPVHILEPPPPFISPIEKPRKLLVSEKIDDPMSGDASSTNLISKGLDKKKEIIRGRRKVDIESSDDPQSEPKHVGRKKPNT